MVHINVVLKAWSKNKSVEKQEKMEREEEVGTCGSCAVVETTGLFDLRHSGATQLWRKVNRVQAEAGAAPASAASARAWERAQGMTSAHVFHEDTPGGNKLQGLNFEKENWGCLLERPLLMFKLHVFASNNAVMHLSTDHHLRINEPITRQLLLYCPWRFTAICWVLKKPVCGS